MLRSLALLVVLAAPPARAGDYEALGRFEREVVDQVLAERRLKIDPAPEGKRVRDVIVATEEVFSPRDGFLEWFNLFHATTRRPVVEREVLLTPGAPWDHGLVDETLRNLRDPALHNVVVLLPVQSGEAGTVDALVVVRDLWSLRLNSNWEVQDGTLSLLSLSLAENNLAGRREKLSLSFTMDQGAISVGPHFGDANLGGTHLSLSSSVYTLFARDGGGYEGTSSDTTFGYPLWSLATPWGATLSVSHFDGVVRRFHGSALATWDDPATTAVEAQPWRYRYRWVDVVSEVVRSFGRGLKLDASLGHELLVTRPALEDGVGQDPVRSAFAGAVLPRDERSSALYARLRLYTPAWGEYRDLATYDLREDLALGPDVSVIVSTALEALGSDDDHVDLGASASWAGDLGASSYLRVAAGWSGRARRAELSDSKVTASLYFASPKLWEAIRIVGAGSLTARLRRSANAADTLGGEEGLRGYPIGAFYGPTSAATHLEVRSMPLALWFFRIGGVAFWDMGHAADSLADLDLHHDLGVGARLLIPQINPYVLRFDWAFPLQGPAPGWPGRFSLGFLQVF